MAQRETERIQDQFARAFEGAAWHGRPVLDLLSHISEHDALSRPVGGNSILDIVNHIDAWLSIVRRRAGGAVVPDTTNDVDWPSPDGERAGAWEAALERLRASYLELHALTGSLDDSRLDDELEGKLRTYTVYEDLHGVVQHSLYHLGQIVILAKGLPSTG